MNWQLSCPIVCQRGPAPARPLGEAEYMLCSLSHRASQTSAPPCPPGILLGEALAPSQHPTAHTCCKLPPTQKRLLPKPNPLLPLPQHIAACRAEAQHLAYSKPPHTNLRSHELAPEASALDQLGQMCNRMWTMRRLPHIYTAHEPRRDCVQPATPQPHNLKLGIITL